ncbi:peptidoglycan recognition protein family protein [Vagococcus elongatus]|uniref:N-acetylmuramoyl-L-alanine amidase n=1 Tax=Vagococcus elongatus TaxID=180344 RepID=A0A430AVW7_9ENTE|nr:N-acetylmuramoyl-L-alanine amidase [Vagococcus elongatus]RSU12200.1 hypothetical protein CBF29_06270 [Vagococcus elongatus]
MANWNGVPYKAQLVASSKWGTKCPYALNAKKITIHNTDNSATAQNEADYHNGNWNETSFHIAVDDVQAVQVIPFNRNAWASGDGGNGYGNRNTIHIEICKNYDRNRNTTNLLAGQQSQYVKAEANAVKIAAAIMVQEGIAAHPDNVKRHYDWNGKWCPSKILNEGRWNTVRALIVAETQRLSGKPVTPAPKPTAPKPVAPSTGLKRGTIAKWATHYQTGQKISPFVIGKAYNIIQTKNVSQSKSKKAYLMAGIMSWVLEQDLVESGINIAAKPSTPAPKPAVTDRWISKKGTAVITTPVGIKLRGTSSGDHANPINLGQLALLPKGSSVVYDKILVQKNGHVWVRQPRSGGYGWMPVSDTKNGVATGGYWVSGVSI